MSDQKPAVSVLGTGSMGSALAEAFLAAGHPTTVWNRSPQRAAPLVAAGARQQLAVADAIAASPLIITCLTTFQATRGSLIAAETELNGRTLVTLNSGAPADARDFARWASGRGARFLGGAIKNVPSAVGKPDTLLYFGGEQAVFDEHSETLRALGGDLVHLGAEPDLAALYESAVGATLLPALLGFFEGAAVLSARGLAARTMVPYSIKWLQMIESLLPIMADEIDNRDFTRLGSSIALFHAAIGDDERLGPESGVDMSWHAPMHDLLRRAVAEGLGEQSITALIQLLAPDPRRIRIHEA
ncbi:NAD(P)-binding domain-containing protein [Nocardia gipuzkoensis]|uniref:NAD(P)-dependent oxidoreductase n=1 Tax=Nocardia gipuzkoensis TaxID=2749991 RepID=UPI001E449547|nr:NAD(P)-binding domain-containing protein [Nocardia gipuzkoensis]UGT69907.1 NAD(P)-binding domain-containing protein [Nocardia gipuzkoensis]